MNFHNTVCVLNDFQSKRKLRDRVGEQKKDSPLANAEILPFSPPKAHVAVLELDDLISYRMLYSEVDFQLLLGKISDLLTREFGRGSVRRENTCFKLGHDQFESLVAGLLRVQFYANMEDLPEYNIFGETSTQEGISLTWGIGETNEFARLDLGRKRRQKEKRRLRRGRKRQS